MDGEELDNADLFDLHTLFHQGGICSFNPPMPMWEGGSQGEIDVRTNIRLLNWIKIDFHCIINFTHKFYKLPKTISCMNFGAED